MEEKKVFTLDEIAEILSVTRRTIYSYVKDGKLEAIKVGKFWRVRKDQLDKFLNGK